MDEKLKAVKNKLNEKSPSLCLAKWLQVTVNLQNGTTHSCHHPVPHKIPLEELKNNPSALHNTFQKKTFRKAMLAGKRPLECDYCWRIEDSHPDNISDRIYKSSEDWSYPKLSEITSLPWDADINPTYMEVSFGNECQFKCAYCSPVVSSAILSEYQKHGEYKANPFFNLDNLKALDQYPYSKDEFNPYVEAFWKWWPELSKKLEVFRITGGEPLLNPNTFQFFENLISSPLPHLDFAINSNLSVPDVFLKKFVSLSKQIMNEKRVRNFEVYTSLDTFGKQAEYIRFGLEYEKFFKNIHLVMDQLPDLKLTIMSTYNALSVPGFTKFLEEIRTLKLKYKLNDYSSRIQLSIPYLRYPQFMAVSVLPHKYNNYIEESLDYMLRNAFEGSFQVFSEQEISFLRRILEWKKGYNPPANILAKNQEAFYSYFTQYDTRKGTSFLSTFPEFSDFWHGLESSHPGSNT